MKIFYGLAAAGALIFITVAVVGQPARAWQAYLLNFLFFSAIAQGAVLFSALMHTVKARWSGPLADVAESFARLFSGLTGAVRHPFYRQPARLSLAERRPARQGGMAQSAIHVRPGPGRTVPAVRARLAFLYHRLYFTLNARGASGPFGRWLLARWETHPPDEDRVAGRMTVFGILYLLAFALVLSLIGYDLVMATDPHWYSTLFGAYSFVKAVYIGFGALIVLSALLHLSSRNDYHVEENQFHDIGKLFFAFCLVWADFSMPSSSSSGTATFPKKPPISSSAPWAAPWNALAWTIFVGCFIAPFLILINRRIKTMPRAMIVICLGTMTGIWLEHYLLLGPSFHHHAHHIPLGWVEAAGAVGFFGLMAAAVAQYSGSSRNCCTAARWIDWRLKVFRTERRTDVGVENFEN